MSTHDDRQQALDTLNGDDAMPGEYCLECHNLGFVIMGNNDRNKVERCDTCRRFDDDEEATKALDQFIAKHAPPAPAEPRKASNGSEIVTMVDLTPRGALTKNGIERIDTAVMTFTEAKADLANWFRNLIRDCNGGCGTLNDQASALRRRLLKTDIAVSVDELTRLLERNRDAEDGLVQAVCGAQ